MASAKFKEAVFWASVVVFYGSGALLALTIINRMGLLPVTGAAAWWFVTMCGAHLLHEAHASSPQLPETESRFRKPDVPQR